MSEQSRFITLELDNGDTAVVDPRMIMAGMPFTYQISDHELGHGSRIVLFGGYVIYSKKPMHELFPGYPAPKATDLPADKEASNGPVAG